MKTEPSPKDNANTRVERLADAIESLCTAIAHKPHTEQHIMARQGLVEALRGFVMPALRVIDGGKDAPRVYANETPEEDRPTCGVCHKNVPCHTICVPWAQAIRRMHENARAAEAAKRTPPEDDGPRVA